jgi:EpsI family protein
MKQRSESGFLNSKAARVLTLVLFAQVVLTYGMTRKEVISPNKPLTEIPMQFGEWRLGQIGVIDQETQDVLKADEVMTRSYVNPTFPVPVNLFVAYFRTQRTGQTPHSPKNCLPGNGWAQSSAGFMNIDIPGRSEPIQVNRYLVAKGENKSVVVYWYQSRDRVVADEYRSKIYSVADAIRYHRSDIAIVRVVVPVMNDNDEEATKQAVQFIQAFFNPVRQHFPA